MFFHRYRAKNRKTMIRNKDHRLENQSPTNTDKIYSNDDFYPLPSQNTTPVSPVTIPPPPPPQTIVSVPRMNYDVPYSPTVPYPPAIYPTAPPPPQPNYNNTPPNYPEIYNTNMILMNGGGGNHHHHHQFSPQQQQSDYATTGGDVATKRLSWEQIAGVKNPKTTRPSTKTLAELHQRKQEVLSQLEKVVGKNAATAISNSATNLARQETQHHDLDSPTSPYYWPSHISTGGPTFVRSDSILADDEYVPYEAPCVSKYGPISRMHKDNVSMGAAAAAQFRENANLMRRPVSAASPVAWLYNTQQLHQAALAAAAAGHTVMPDTTGYITIGSPQVIMRMQDPSKELLAESQRVKLQLRNLEKQLNDLKQATQGVTSLSESERLAQELQLIEQGIQEKQKEARLVSYFSFYVVCESSK